MLGFDVRKPSPAAACGSDRQPEAMTVTTPADFHRAFPGTGGALYGRASHGWMASFQRAAARSRIPGLYFAGGSTHPGAGLPMAALSGRLAAQAVASRLGFAKTVPPGGYAWWYVDGLSDDGQPRHHADRLHRQRVLALLRLVGPRRSGGSLRAQCRALRPARPSLGDDGARPRRDRREAGRLPHRPQRAELGRQCAQLPDRRSRRAPALAASGAPCGSIPPRSRTHCLTLDDGQPASLVAGCALLADRGGARASGAVLERQRLFRHQ